MALTAVSAYRAPKRMIRLAARGVKILSGWKAYYIGDTSYDNETVSEIAWLSHPIKTTADLSERQNLIL